MSIKRLIILKILALNVILLMLVSPGLFVTTYLQKFIATIESIKNIVIKIGSCFSNPTNKIITNPIDKEKNMIPIISDKPAIAWLNKPILFSINSSV